MPSSLSMAPRDTNEASKGSLFSSDIDTSQPKRLKMPSIVAWADSHVAEGSSCEKSSKNSTAPTRNASTAIADNALLNLRKQ
eukprot:1663231-Karenia_brevis.AAC.1